MRPTEQEDYHEEMIKHYGQLSPVHHTEIPVVPVHHEQPEDVIPVIPVRHASHDDSEDSSTKDESEFERHMQSHKIAEKEEEAEFDSEQLARKIEEEQEKLAFKEHMRYHKI